MDFLAYEVLLSLAITGILQSLLRQPAIRCPVTISRPLVRGGGAIVFTGAELLEPELVPLTFAYPSATYHLILFHQSLGKGNPIRITSPFVNFWLTCRRASALVDVYIYRNARVPRRAQCLCVAALQSKRGPRQTINFHLVAFAQLSPLLRIWINHNSLKE